MNLNREQFQIPKEHIDAIKNSISQIETDNDMRIEPSPQGVGGATLNIGGRRVPSRDALHMTVFMDGDRLDRSTLSQKHLVEKEGVRDPGGLLFKGGPRAGWSGVAAFGPIKMGHQFTGSINMPAGSTARDHAEASLSALREAHQNNDFAVKDEQQSPRKTPTSGVRVTVHNMAAVRDVSDYHYDPATGNISHWKDS